MLFNRGQKFHIKNAEFFITIEGSMNGSQGIHKKYPSENHYNIDINGGKTFISESQLMRILNAQKKEEKKAPVIVKPVVEVKPEIKEDKEKEDIIEESKITPKKRGLFSWKNK